MSFEYHKYLAIAVPLLVVHFYFFRRNDKEFFQWVEDHWFLKRSISSKVSRLFFFVAMALLALSTLDLRGPEEKIETSIPDQKTIILLDKSASMLVEDVRPNRFKKAVMMARHFVKKAAGHQVSIIVFSDTHKRVVPFTDDIDLLDSILGGLLDLDINVGGSELSVAMKEATSYFTLENEYKGGNLLVFTDGEEHDSLENFKLQDDINLAIVGIGTLNGGPIPLRRKGGSFQGYKKYEGKEINSKLNEVNIKKFVNRTKNSKYWISLSYSLPTDEILDFFRQKFQSKLSKGQSRIRPVLVKYLVIPAVFIYLLSYLISLRRSYAVLSLLLVVTLATGRPVAAEEKEISPNDIKAQALLEKMRQGDLDETGKLKIAEELLKLNKSKESSTIYQETIKNIDEYPNNTLLNMGTSLLKSGKIGEALDLFDKIRERREFSEEERKIIETNTLRAIQKSKQDKKEQEDKKKEEEKEKKKNEDKKKQDKGEKDQSGDKKEDKKGKGSQNQNEKDQKPSENKNDKDEDKEDNKKKNEESDNKDDKKNKQKKTIKEKESDIKKKRKMVKIPATLKQIMNDDRGLQKKYLKTTIGKDKRSERRDW
ncbi:VWA domain-containing protein [Halobacteriovorax sp. JY17]|uniref:vWA domain-containing protein n=1 Tax=Halobacteriovorax sp. JY17 TaxID=2014617 RepID=UPI000C45B08E|nr:VWA domain-containing protein [Halobacteriovorax sp. JY17]PIK14465.1 MAG: hypothetical protein CES88_08970 [Halobacteriovorax sp. JY17]